jgi:predicted DNA-binding protein YlxM (UPF0122 family)
MMKKEISRKKTEKEETAETWRKPLSVPPRANAMRSFYRGEEEKAEDAATNAPEILQSANVKEQAILKKVKSDSATVDKINTAHSMLHKNSEREKKPQLNKQLNRAEKGAESEEVDFKEEIILESTVVKSDNSLTAEELSLLLGIELEDLFDVNELLRGKSFELYRALWEATEGRGRRCKLTQPELMRRTAIKNRRTFYKHEEWLLKLRLLEKRHLPGDHKGVVYRVFALSEVLPLDKSLIEQFEREIKNF